MRSCSSSITFVAKHLLIPFTVSLKHRTLILLKSFPIKVYINKTAIARIVQAVLLKCQVTHIDAGECPLNWPQRHKIALSIAQGLVHLHLEPPSPLVHGNLKTSTILVDGHHNALLTGYGLHLLASPAVVNAVVLDAANEEYSTKKT